MKKILFLLVALVCGINMNAQIMKVMKGNTVVATYTAEQADKVVFEEAQGPTTTGTAKRKGNIDVKWVQLWEDGPKFAEYNVGTNKNRAQDYGGHYCWGSSIDKDPNAAYNSGTDALSGTDDTATNLWGSNWRMPTQAELQALIANCDVEWTTFNGVNGRKFTGKGDYASNSVFFPAAGLCNNGDVSDQGGFGACWSSTPNGSSYAFYLGFDSNYKYVFLDDRFYGYSVRAVLAE